MKRPPINEENIKIALLKVIDFVVKSTKTKFLTYPFIWLTSLLLIYFDVAFKGRSYCGAIRDAYKLSKFSALMLACRTIALPYRDYAVAQTLLTGNDNIHDWTVNELNSRGIDELRNSGASCIVANGHFTRQAYYAVFRRDVLPQRLMQVALPPNPGTGRLEYDRRIEIQFGSLLSAAKYSRPEDLEFAVVGVDKHILRTMLRHLKQSSGVILMNIDAPWDGKNEHCYVRPFAGHKAKKFARGIIEIARISGCPIISIIPVFNNDKTITLLWGDPMYVNDSMSEAEQNGILDRLIDPMEVAVGRRPDQYLMPIGVDRCWDQHSDNWGNPPPS
jgi:hypothetical protein